MKRKKKSRREETIVKEFWISIEEDATLLVSFESMPPREHGGQHGVVD